MGVAIDGHIGMTKLAAVLQALIDIGTIDNLDPRPTSSTSASFRSRQLSGLNHHADDRRKACPATSC